eukprot:37446_1
MSGLVMMGRLDIAKKSVKHIRLVIVVNVLCVFIYCGRSSMWLSYSKRFTPNESAITFVHCIEFIALEIAGFWLCMLGQRFSYDTSIAILLATACIGCLIESVANNFITLCIGHLTSQTLFIMMYISTAYITWILPFEYSIIYIPLNYSLILLFGVSASLFTWIINYYWSYRITFLIYNILVLITFVIGLVLFILNKQRKLQHEQLHIEEAITHQSKIPPLSMMPSIKPLSGIASPASNTDSTHAQNIKHHKRFPIFLHKMNVPQYGDKLYGLVISERMQWYLLVHYIIQIGFIYGLISMFYSYYPLWLYEKYSNATPFTCGLQLLLSAIASSLGGITTLFLSNKSTYLFQRVFTFSALILQFIIIGFTFIKTSHFHYNTIWCSIMMFVIGSLLVQYEILLLNIQNPMQSGKINAIKAIVTNVIRSICILFPQILWNQNTQRLWHAAIVANTIMLLSEMFHVVLFANLQQTKKDDYNSSAIQITQRK